MYKFKGKNIFDIVSKNIIKANSKTHLFLRLSVWFEHAGFTRNTIICQQLNLAKE